MPKERKGGACIYCGRTIPETKHICWACTYKFNGIHSKCEYCNETGYCILKNEDCSPMPCKWYHERTENEKEGYIYE